LLRRTIAPPPTPSRIYGDHRLQRGARALLRGGDGGISFYKRSQHVDGQLLQAPVTLGPFTTTLRMHLGCCQPRCLPQCLLAHSSSTETRIPYGFSGWPSGHLLRCTLNGVLPQTQGIPCLTGLNPRALDPQTSALRPLKFAAVRLPWSERVCVLRVSRRTPANDSPWLHIWLHSATPKGDTKDQLTHHSKRPPTGVGAPTRA
jgi:hypothetical protein